MITQLVVRTRSLYNDAIMRTFTFALSGSEYVVRNIEGLGPVKSEITTMDVPTEPGRSVLNARDTYRNVVLTAGFSPLPGNSAETLRRALNQTMMPSTPVELVFTDSVMGAMSIRGYVESNEPLIFSQDPSTQISFICPMPYFKGVGGIQVLTGLSTPTFNINYTGDVPIGFVYECDVTSSGSYLLLSNQPAEYLGFVRTNFAFAAGDHYMVSTVPGDRYVKYIRSAATNNLIGYTTGSMTRLKLIPGINYFTTSVFSGAGKNNLKISYEPLFGSL